MRFLSAEITLKREHPADFRCGFRVIGGFARIAIATSVLSSPGDGPAARLYRARPFGLVFLRGTFGTVEAEDGGDDDDKANEDDESNRTPAANAVGQHYRQMIHSIVFLLSPPRRWRRGRVLAFQGPIPGGSGDLAGNFFPKHAEAWTPCGSSVSWFCKTGLWEYIGADRMAYEDSETYGQRGANGFRRGTGGAGGEMAASRNGGPVDIPRRAGDSLHRVGVCGGERTLADGAKPCQRQSPGTGVASGTVAVRFFASSWRGFVI
jgi:hypothetical protein